MSRASSFDPLDRNRRLIIGARQCGKSQLMKEAMEAYIKVNPGAVVYLASATGTKRLQ